MTDRTNAPPAWLAKAWAYLSNRIIIALTGFVIWATGAVVVLIFTPISQWASAMIEVPEKVAAISLEVAELRGEVAQATGDDRVIRQPRGLSYVTEPVHVGEEVVFNLVIERTTLGASCNFLGGQSLFTEDGGVMTPGSAIPAATQRLAEQQTRLRLRLAPPVNLRPGRIELYLALEYDCDGKTVFDRTDTVVYQLLSRE
ncbi:hypothetical protein [Falsirhodobacter halotolerans]|uniref:hypothetical protein n=1 Tax=Falsirhodobacter halotolerans TaxID=1146892 RepID=UPI001FD3DE22|nr:hypothetical protein [Falsirhodobacter halotolerans]MCJ8139340.1 hypothetical protein [Falsirhodobacter halotolerans]